MSATIDPISVRQFEQLIQRGEPLALLDVREAWERRWVSIPVPPHVVDVHIPMGIIPQHFDEIKMSIVEMPLVVYCHHGVRSRLVAEWLTARGAKNVLNLDGGIEAWSVVVDPMVKRY